MLADMTRRGINDVPRKLHLMPYDLLRAIGRQPTGRAYELLGQALDGLGSTTMKTNIHAENRREATFSWLDGWTQLVDEKTERSRGMTIELSSWFWEGVMMTGGVLSIDRAYFDISGGRERWLYKVARKHAGGAGEAGFAISMPTLFEKSGAEGQYRRFKFEIAKIAKIAERDELPGYALSIEQPDGKREPSLRMCRRVEGEVKALPGAKPVKVAKAPSPASIPEPTAAPEAPEVDAAALIRRTSPPSTGTTCETSNPIEGVFATVRHRTVRTKGALSPTTARLMVFKLVIAASRTWRRLKGENQLPKVVAGVRFQDGTEVTDGQSTRAA